MSRLQELGLCEWCRNSLDGNERFCQSCTGYSEKTGKPLEELAKSNIISPRTVKAMRESIPAFAEATDKATMGRNAMTQDYEYQVSVDRGCIGHNSDPTRDPKEAGKLYREQCKSVAGNGNGTVELKRRPIGPWEVVESVKV